MNPLNKLKWKFRSLYQRIYYWLEWRISDERHDPYRCEVCGSTDVEIKAWIKPNEGGRYAGDCEEFDRSFCNNCDENVRVRPTSYMLQDVLRWWAKANFQLMERITGYRRINFDPADGYRAFVDTCNQWWGKLSTEEKIEIWFKK